MGILKEASRTRYALNRTEITNNEVISLILAVAMKIDKGSYYSFTELNGFDVLFPFGYSVSKEYILTDKHFMATHFSGEMTLSLKE